MIGLFDSGFRFAAAALLGLLAFLVFRQSPNRTPALLAIAFVIGIASYLTCSAPFWKDLSKWVRIPLVACCLANPLLFWLLARSIFEDGFKLHWSHLLMLAAVEAFGSWYVFGPHEANADIGSQSSVAALVGGALQGVGIAFVIAALVTAYRGRVPDLVESRRKFRTLFVSVAGGYMAFVTLIEVFLRGAAPHPVASLLNAAMIFVIVFMTAISLLTLKLNLLFEPVRPPLAAIELDVAERDLLQRLDEALAQQVYKQEGLTIGQLARQLGAQEHHLRPLINAKLGFRNFNDFLNHHRVQQARQQLADAAMARIPVLTIAMNLGYGSIGPFNRAFKQATGLTPTEFRRRSLTSDGNSSKPEAH